MQIGNSNRFAAGLFAAAIGLAPLVCPVGAGAGDVYAQRFVHPGSPRPQSAATGQADAADKDRIATAAVFLLVLVAVVGLSLLALVIWWGRRVRLAARKPSPRITPGDELWYLKPDKQNASTPAASAVDDDDRAERDSDSADRT